MQELQHSSVQQSFPIQTCLSDLSAFRAAATPAASQNFFGTGKRGYFRRDERERPLHGDAAASRPGKDL